MIYVTTRQKEKEKQISWLDLIEEDESVLVSSLGTTGSAGTITRMLPEATPELLSKINVDYMINVIKKFNEVHEELFTKERNSLYRYWFIPKKSGGGMRRIDAPCDELQNALDEIRIILTEKFGVLYHTGAFGYVKGRSTIQTVRKHQVNESNWFYHTDASGFFPNTTLDFTMKMLKMIFPLSEICKVDEGYKALRKMISLGFLNGGLPQGTKLSPTLTNVICIPIDHKIFNDLAHKRFVYTRYADDIHISCVQKFDEDRMTKYIQGVFKSFGAPWELKPEKTHFGNKAGRNFMLGICLNKDNNITVGYKTKAVFKAQTTNLILDWKAKKYWPHDEIQQYSGLLSYYKMVEKDYFEQVIERLNNKFHVDLKTILKNYYSLNV